MGGLNVIMSSDFYHVPPIWDSWIFSSKNIRFSILTTKFSHENVKCYELHKIMRQNDVHSINILIGFNLLHKQMKTYILWTFSI
jgi:hypothetical protein